MFYKLLNIDTIKRKLITLFSIVVLISTTLAIVILLQYKHYISESESIVNQVNMIQHKADELRTHFILQSNEWKNLLIRGSNKEDYQAHLTNFKQYSNIIQADIAVLSDLTMQIDDVNQLVIDFSDAYQEMMQRYLEALPAYMLAKNKPALTTDNYVRGINDEANNLVSLLERSISLHHIYDENENKKLLLVTNIFTLSSGAFATLLLAFIFISTI